MRLICPNCGAQYEIDDAAIPPGGRDVQCADCQFSWFHTRRDPLVLRQPAPTGDRPGGVSGVGPVARDGAEEEVAPPAAPPRRRQDPQVLAVLREEAEREHAARATDAGPGDVRAMVSRGSEPPSRDAGPAPEAECAEDRSDPPAATPPAAGPPGRASARAGLRASAGLAPEPAAVAAPPTAATEPAVPSIAPRAPLPAASQAHAASPATVTGSAADPAPRVATPAPADPAGNGVPPPRAGSAGGRLLGMTVAFAAFGVAALVYFFPQRAVQTIPSFESEVAGYVAQVDAGRVWLDAQLDGVLGVFRSNE